MTEPNTTKAGARTHQQIGTGYCKECGHYGEDCLGFTPGPWVIEPYAGHYLITTADFDEGHPDRLGEIVANTRDSQNSKANAELIAAAPDLFRQLAALATQLESAGLIVPPGLRAVLDRCTNPV